MSGTVLSDALGPRGRRRVMIATVVSTAAIAALALVAVGRLEDNRQLVGDKWSRFFEPAVLGFLWDGLYSTLKLALTGIALALPAGVALALLRTSRRAPVRWLAASWIEVFRGVPLILLMLFTFLGADDLPGVESLSPFRAALLALVLYNSAVLAEIVRAGIGSLDRGQGQAAAALGLTDWQAMRLVILPQALRRMVPALISQLITLLKDTSLATVVTYSGLLRQFQFASQPSSEHLTSADLQGYILCALVFVAINFTLSRVARRLEVRQRHRYQTGSVGPVGGEDVSLLTAADRP